MRKLIVIAACLLVTGCMNSAPCEEKWVKRFNAKGQVMYVLESSNCVSVKMKEIYQ